MAFILIFLNACLKLVLKPKYSVGFGTPFSNYLSIFFLNAKVIILALPTNIINLKIQILVL